MNPSLSLQVVHVKYNPGDGKAPLQLLLERNWDQKRSVVHWHQWSVGDKELISEQELWQDEQKNVMVDVLAGFTPGGRWGIVCPFVSESKDTIPCPSLIDQAMYMELPDINSATQVPSSTPVNPSPATPSLHSAASPSVKILEGPTEATSPAKIGGRKRSVTMKALAAPVKFLAHFAKKEEKDVKSEPVANNIPFKTTRVLQHVFPSFNVLKSVPQPSVPTKPSKQLKLDVQAYRVGWFLPLFFGQPEEVSAEQFISTLFKTVKGKPLVNIDFQFTALLGDSQGLYYISKVDSIPFSPSDVTGAIPLEVKQAVGVSTGNYEFVDGLLKSVKDSPVSSIPATNSALLSSAQIHFGSKDIVIMEQIYGGNTGAKDDVAAESTVESLAVFQSTVQEWKEAIPRTK